MIAMVACMYTREEWKLLDRDKALSELSRSSGVGGCHVIRRESFASWLAQKVRKRIAGMSKESER